MSDLWTVDLSFLASCPFAELAERRIAWDRLHFWSALQGIANRDQPSLYTFFEQPDRFWWAEIRKPGEWLADRVARAMEPDEVAATKLFSGSLRGAVVWQESVPACSLIASAVAGADDLIPLRFDPSPTSLYWRLTQDPEGPRLPINVEIPAFEGTGTIPGTSRPSSGSRKADAYLWLIEHYLKPGKVKPEVFGYYPDAFWLQDPNEVEPVRTLLPNHDYVIAKKGLVFDLSPWDDEAPRDEPDQPLGADYAALTELLRVAREHREDGFVHIAGFVPWDQKYTQYTGGKHGDVPSEWRFIEIASAFDAFVDADAPRLHMMANASVFCHFPLREHYPQANKTTRARLTDLGHLDEAGEPENKAFVSFYVGDYDAAAWLYRMIPDLWADPVRGTIPLGWSFNPLLERRFPLGLHWTRQHASAEDVFMTGDSGAGYINPGHLREPRAFSGLPSGVARWEAFSTPFLRRWDLTITGFVIDGYAPPMDGPTKESWARMTPDGVIGQKLQEVEMVGRTPFVRIGRDMPADLGEACDIICRNAPEGKFSAAVYRTVLWSPATHKELMDRVRERRPDIEFVEPHALMQLVKASARARVD